MGWDWGRIDDAAAAPGPAAFPTGTPSAQIDRRGYLKKEAPSDRLLRFRAESGRERRRTLQICGLRGGRTRGRFNTLAAFSRIVRSRCGSTRRRER